jgi:hypothetical protein
VAESSGPWAGQPLPDNLYQRLFSNYGEGVFGNVFGSAPVTVTAAGDGVVAAPFEAIVRGRYYQIDTNVTLNPPASSAQPRIDRLVLRLDPGSGRGTLAFVQGTPSSSPQVPALTQSFNGIWEMPKAQMTVSPGTPRVSNVVIDQPFLGMPTIPCRTNNRPGMNGTPTPRVGQPIFDADLKQTLTWDGANWINPAAPAVAQSIPKIQKYAFPWPEPNPANPTFGAGTSRILLTTVQVVQSYAYSIGCYVQAEVGTKAAGTRWDLYVEGYTAGGGGFLVGFTNGAGKFGDEVITPQTTVSVPAATAIIPAGQICNVNVSAIRAYGPADGKIPVAGRSLVVYTIPA